MKQKRKFVFDFSSDVEDDEEDKYKIKIRDTSVCEVNFSDEDLGTPKAGNSPQKEL